jgi:hypothetical protein
MIAREIYQKMGTGDIVQCQNVAIDSMNRVEWWYLKNET